MLADARQSCYVHQQHGRRETNHWWKEDRWKRLEPELAAWLVERLKVLGELIVVVDQAVRELTRQLEAKAPKSCQAERVFDDLGGLRALRAIRG